MTEEECKAKKKEYKHKWYIENKDRILKKTKEYNKIKYKNDKGHREKVLEYGKEYRKKNKEKETERKHKYYLKNRKKILEYNKEYYENHKEEKREYAKQYREMINIINFLKDEGIKDVDELKERMKYQEEEEE